MKKIKMEKTEFRAFIKIRAKLGVSLQTITDELVFIITIRSQKISPEAISS